MNNNSRPDSSNPNAGFSLKELLVVVVIIFILVSVVSAFFVRYIEKSNEQADVYNMKIVAREAEAGALLGLYTEGTEYYFDEEINGIVEDAPSSGYGRGTSRSGGVYYTNYVPEMNVVGDYLCIKKNLTGVEVYWHGFESVGEEKANEE